MKRIVYLFSLLSMVGLHAVAGIEQPNIIIFYVDDLGWQDVELNDVDEPCPYETPNIQKLADAGMNFTQGYSPAPSCSPSRAGINSGQHPAKIGLTHVNLGEMKKGGKDDLLVEPYLQSHLDLDILTLADAMKQNGYRTGHVGKWHVGLTAASYGFDFVDEDRGVHRGMNDRTKDFATADDAKYPLSKKKYPPVSDKKPDGISYPYDQVTESALTFMEESKNGPFFLNLCHWMVHWPVLTRNGELLEYYCDKMGQPFPPKPGDMTLPGQQNPYFAAMVTTVDWSLGRVVDFLEKTDDPRNPGKRLIETTYIFFTSDNGGAEKKAKEIISDNYPLKYGKTHTEDGGIRVPMVIVGPGIARGSRFEGLVNQLDYFTKIITFKDSQKSTENHQKLSGLNITPVLTGESDRIVDANGAERDHLFWHFPHGSMKSAIRSGDFKLYKRYATDDYELYRLYKDGKRDDLEEQHDLAQHPEYSEAVDRLSKILEADLLAYEAQGPYLNPDYAQKEKVSAAIVDSAFEASSRAAELALETSGPAIEKAYVIYRSAPAMDAKPAKNKSRKKGEARGTSIDGDMTEWIGMKVPATILSDGYAVTATIPEGVPAAAFLLIDANKFQHYSEIPVSP